MKTNQIDYLTLYRKVLKRAKEDEFFFDEIIGEYMDLLEEHCGLEMLEGSMEEWEEDNHSYTDSLLTTGN